MQDILYLTHRIPYPPNKGDKVRSYHLLKHLVGRHRVFLGTFVDDPDDEQRQPGDIEQGHVLRRALVSACDRAGERDGRRRRDSDSR